MNSESIYIIGLSVYMLIGILGFVKIFKNKRYAIIIASISVLMLCVGLVIRDPSLHTKKGNAADALMSPFFYVCSYYIIRFLTERTYGTNYIYKDSKLIMPYEKRAHQLAFIFVHVIPFLIAGLLPILISGETRNTPP